MGSDNKKKRFWFNFLGALILVAGLAGAALIYYQAVQAPAAVELENSKLYTHNLEVYGGKFSVIMDDFRRWFVGLWQGKSLAIIIAVTTIVISGGFFYAANYPTQEDNSEEPINPDDA